MASVLRWAVRVAAAATVAARAVAAQPPAPAAPGVVSLGLAGGVATPPPSISRDPRRGRFHSALLLGVAPRGWPLALRGELAWAHWASSAGPVSLAATAVVPVGTVALRPGADPERLRPYVLAGLGLHGVGGVAPRDGGWHGGAGLRLEGARVMPFTEARWLSAYRRALLAGGVTLGF